MLNTKAKAKRAAINMWTWLRDHPDKGKRDYKKSNLWLSRCALCEYAINHTEKGCGACPLLRCLSVDSPYQAWSIHGHKASDAQRIIDKVEAW